MMECNQMRKRKRYEFGFFKGPVIQNPNGQLICKQATDVIDIDFNQVKSLATLICVVKAC